MAYVALPNPKKNSLSTKLSGDILIDATTIPVTECSIFYDDTGTLITEGIVIAFDNATESASEEIKITGCSAASGAGNLTGVTREVGVDGTNGAKAAWTAGTNIAVMFTSTLMKRIADDLADHETNKAPLASPSFTGTPLSTTAAADTDTTQIATTAFVLGQASDTAPGALAVAAAAGSSERYARYDHIHPVSPIPLNQTPGDDTYSGIVATFSSTSSTSQWELVFMAGAGTMTKAKADAIATMPVRAIATDAIDGSGVYLLKGFIRHDAWSFTPGAPLYCSDGTAGLITASVPTGSNHVVQQVGWAVAEDIIWFDPNTTYLELT